MAVTNSLANQAPKQSFSVFLTGNAIKMKINEVIGGKDGQRFMTQILSAVTNNPALQACQPMSILNCAFLGESLKLSPSPQLGQFYMVPFEKKIPNTDQKESVATFILGTKGYKQLAMRTGQYKDIDTIEIRQGEYLGKDKETGKPLFTFVEDDDLRDALPIVGYLAYFELLNGFRKRIYWTKSKMEKHADTYSAAFNLKTHKLIEEGKIPAKDMWKYSSFWYKNFDEMAKKTVIRNILSQWGIMSIDMQTAFENDISLEEKSGNDYVDNADQIDPTNAQRYESEADIQSEVEVVSQQEAEIPFDEEEPDFLNSLT